MDDDGWFVLAHSGNHHLRTEPDHTRLLDDTQCMSVKENLREIHENDDASVERDLELLGKHVLRLGDICIKSHCYDISMKLPHWYLQPQGSWARLQDWYQVIVREPETDQVSQDHGYLQ